MKPGIGYYLGQVRTVQIHHEYTLSTQAGNMSLVWRAACEQVDRLKMSQLGWAPSRHRDGPPIGWHVVRTCHLNSHHSLEEIRLVGLAGFRRAEQNGLPIWG